jgi:hypothetical protein
VANSPLVKAALHGGDPTGGGSRRRSAGAAGHRAAGRRRRDRGRAGLRARRRVGLRREALAAAWRATRSSTSSSLPGEGHETEVFFSDLSHEYVTDQRGVHDVSDARRRHAARGAALHPEFHGKTVVIKYGGAAMEDPALREEFARDVVLLKYVGLNPIVVHGGGPEITAYMERLGMPVEFVGGLRVSNARDRGGGQDGPRRQGQQGHRPAPQPPRPACRRAVRR